MPIAMPEELTEKTGWFDSEADSIVMAIAFARRFWSVQTRMATMFIQKDIRRHVIEGSSNIWVRDYFPVQVGNHFVQFRYAASYDGGMPRHDLLVDIRRETDRILGQAHVIDSEIILDNGGNCIRYGDRAIVSDIIFRRNPGWTKKTLLGLLEHELEAEVIIVPCEPGDEMGHADGIVRWVDEKTVLINDYGVMPVKRYSKFISKLIGTLHKANLEARLLPFAYHRSPSYKESEFRRRYPDADDFNPGFGYYINFLQMRGLILLPIFDVPEDDAAVHTMQKTFPDTEIRSIDCAHLSLYGGLLNCIGGTFRSR